MFHRAYEPGTACFDSILEALGSDLKAENGQIDRRKLGAKVFANPELLRKLESIVWPEILRMAMEDLKKLHQDEGKSVIILDAAVLLQGMGFSLNFRLMYQSNSGFFQLVGRKRSTKFGAHL